MISQEHIIMKNNHDKQSYNGSIGLCLK